MNHANRGLIPVVVRVAWIVGGTSALVAGVLWYQRTGLIETELQPQIARLSADPRNISVGATWTEGGWCIGEFQARATETPSEVRVAIFDREFTHGANCAGVGTVYNTAWADVTLKLPIGTRAIVRSSDGQHVPVLTQDEQFLRRHPIAADIKQFDGLNSNPPFALKREAHIIDPTSLGALATQLDSLPSFTPTRDLNCPNDDGAFYQVELDYPSEGATMLKINSYGCAGVYVNGLKKPTAQALSGRVNIFPLLNSLLSG